MRQHFEPIALRLRKSSQRQAILIRLLGFDNFLRRWITFFSFENNLHPKHRLTKYHDFFTNQVTSTDTVLDIGCGGGQLANDVAQVARQVVGIDISADYLAPTKQYQSQPNLSFIQGDATVYDFNDRFDVIILSNVLEHIDDRIGFMKQLKPIARKFLIRVPMIDRDWIVLLKQELQVNYLLDPTHFIEYTERSFRREIAAAGLDIQQLDIRFGEIYALLTQPSS